jgi:uncharacterized lipoprotein YajG
MTSTMSVSRRAVRLATLLALVGALVLAGCGTKTVSSTNENGQVSTQTVPNVHFAA